MTWELAVELLFALGIGFYLGTLAEGVRWVTASTTNVVVEHRGHQYAVTKIPDGRG